MEIADLEHFRNLLTARERSLTNLLSPGASVGEDMISKVRSLLSQIGQALKRIEEGSYGCCHVCHDSIERDRLEAQPTIEVCLDCLSDEAKAKLEYELLVASRIHRALLPQATPVIEGFSVAVESRVSSSVGGDYYDFLPSPDGNKLRIIIADSMGKGIPAGLLMSNLQGILKVLTGMTESPALLLSRLNQWLCHNIAATTFASLACLELELDSRPHTKLSYANAGHPSPILINREGEIKRLESTGVLLGIDDTVIYDPAEIEIYPDDLLLLYTDGITEAENLFGEMYEEERLVAYLRHRGDEPVDQLVRGLVNDVSEFCGRRELEDDLTLVALRRNG